MPILQILFFSHDKCAPCIPVREMLKKINISMFGKKLFIEKVDIYDNSTLTKKYNITSVPTLIIGKSRLSVNIQEEDIVDAILREIVNSVEI